ncbi:MAG: hypothetical protein HY706_10795 [Candidatus Hydrogenedentes bacterium]|nr:hypothetical protein [Candidatus Hydrogenedentota bacterium]
MLKLSRLVIVVCLFPFQAAIAAEVSMLSDWEKAEPGLSYGRLEDFPLPKSILFSIGPDDLLADAEEWSRRGVSAFFLDFIAREWSSDIWAADGKAWTIGASDEFFQKAARANEVCRRIGSETFLKISFDHFFEWSNDTAWQRIDHNFRQFAIFARDTGCTGIALDIEYVGLQYDFGWEGYTYEGYTRGDLIRKIHDRMTRVMQVLYDEFPDMVFLTFPEQGFSLGNVIHTAWIEEAARRNAPGGLHYCTEHTYRDPNIRRMFCYAWTCNALFDKLLSDRAKKYWTERCSIAAGIWPFGFDNQSVYDPGMPLEEFRQGYAASLMMSRRYNWIYSHNCREQLIGRGLDKYTGDADLRAYLRVIADREVVTTPKYVALARELRDLGLRDYTSDLGWAIGPGFAGPSDVPMLEPMPIKYSDPERLQEGWKLALDYYHGKEINLRKHFGTQTHWMLIGPFPSEKGLTGHSVVYPPEQAIDLAAEYDGLGGKVRWQEFQGQGSQASVDLTKVFKPTEQVCAYAFCHVASPQEQEVQVRLGTNDAGKLWIGGALLYDYPGEDTAWLDHAILPVKLSKGTTPFLIKVTNGVHNWGFVFRITDQQGKPIGNLQYLMKE